MYHITGLSETGVALGRECWWNETNIFEIESFGGHGAEENVLYIVFGSGAEGKVTHLC